MASKDAEAGNAGPVPPVLEKTEPSATQDVVIRASEEEIKDIKNEEEKHTDASFSDFIVSSCVEIDSLMTDRQNRGSSRMGKHGTSSSWLSEP